MNAVFLVWPSCVHVHNMAGSLFCSLYALFPADLPSGRNARLVYYLFYFTAGPLRAFDSAD